MFPKIVGFPPKNHPLKNRGFPVFFTIHFGVLKPPPIFGLETPPISLRLGDFVRWNFRWIFQVFLGELEDAVCTSSAIEEMEEQDEDDDDEDEICGFFFPKENHRGHEQRKSSG